MRSSDSRPDRTASITAWICSAGCCGSRSTSAPASTARMAISASLYFCRTPSIRSESVAITPGELQLVPQHPGQHLVAEGGRVARRLEGGEGDVRGHDRVHPGLDGGPERRGVDLLPLLAGCGSMTGSDVCESDAGVAVAGEVLGGRGDLLVLQTADRGGHVLRHQLRIRGERPDADDGVGRVDVHVGVRRVVGVDADRPQLTTGDLVGVVGQLRVAGRTQGHGAGEDRGRRTDPSDQSGLLVGGDTQRHGVAGRGVGALQTVAEAGRSGPGCRCCRTRRSR